MIAHEIDLKPYNTFGLSVKALSFATFSSLEQLKEILNNNTEPLLILGGGSNVLLTKNFNGLVLKNEILGFEVEHENQDDVLVKVGAGENWHQTVLKCIELGYAGLENLSLIPGSVGATPMQNIGAYGVEIKDVFHQLEAYHIPSKTVHHFNNEQCEFGYRESVFKTKFKGEYVILNVTYRLSKKFIPHTSYGAIASELEKMNLMTPNIKDISNAVIQIRSSKLPDPKIIGNAGSFFKNPVVGIDILKKIQKTYPEVPSYPVDDLHVKVPAGWLIEKAGWKGKTFDHYGVHTKQALVLVNYGGATGKEIFELSEKIIEDIHSRFGILLEREVNIL